WLTVGVVLAQLVLYATLDFWHGDDAWGPRYLVPITAIFMLWTAPVLAAWRLLGRVVRTGIVALVVAGTAIQVVAVTVGYERVLHVLERAAPTPAETESNPGFYFALAHNQLVMQFQGFWAMLFGP